MSKVTRKLQVTVPKVIADAYEISPGDEIDWIPAGDSIRVVAVGELAAKPGLERRLELFDQATERQRARDESAGRVKAPRTRGWSRAELYERGGAG